MYVALTIIILYCQLEKRLHVIKTYYLVVILVIPLTLMLPHTHYMVSK